VLRFSPKGITKRFLLCVETVEVSKTFQNGFPKKPGVGFKKEGGNV
jgi:hypothetical protein